MTGGMPRALRRLRTVLCANVEPPVSVTAGPSSPPVMSLTRITVTPEGIARARADNMLRAGVGASVTPELLAHARDCGELLRRKRQGRA